MDDKAGETGKGIVGGNGTQRPVCPNCGGTGNLSTFRGESRFMFTHEECPFCFGFGYVPEEENGSEGHEPQR